MKGIPVYSIEKFKAGGEKPYQVEVFDANRHFEVEYPHCHDFFEVLTIKDVTLINDWSMFAAAEIILYEYNEGSGQRIYSDISEKIREQTTNLAKDKKHLVDLYLENLNKYWQL